MSLQISDAVIWQETAGGISLYHTESGDFHSLNETASRIWTLVADKGEREAIVSELSQQFSGGSVAVSVRIVKDVQAFLGTMIEQGLIEERPALS
ncbi:PqqD family protein [Nonomuraea sp. ATR24]|uniref:PqqD family protein n=1 Tax=Nonomuraea TaxID=83681 RepID=UPI001C5E1DFB|nr:PqqD family protein [Nonomuraea ceibae]